MKKKKSEIFRVFFAFFLGLVFLPVLSFSHISAFPLFWAPKLLHDDDDNKGKNDEQYERKKKMRRERGGRQKP